MDIACQIAQAPGDLLEHQAHFAHDYRVAFQYGELGEFIDAGGAQALIDVA